MNNYPLLYRNQYGNIVRFRRIKERVYECENGAIMQKCQLAYKYVFIKDERVREVFETTVNGFRVRKKINAMK